MCIRDSYILVRDAHDTGTNLDARALPACAELIRGWSGHPYCMVEGIDSSFDAALFIGYHSAAGRDGNPLSHTNNPVSYTHLACFGVQMMPRSI